MFGDAGQGALLALLGATFRIRGTGNLKKWGTLILASGISAVIAGLIVGEAFGFHIFEVPGGEYLKSLGFIGILNAADFSEETVLTILTFFHQYRYYTLSKCFCIFHIQRNQTRQEIRSTN